MLSDHFTLFSTVVTGTSTAYPVHAFDRIAISIQWYASTLAGQIVLEYAHTPSYTGTWKNIGTYNFINDAAGAQDGESFDWSGDVWVRARFATNATADCPPNVQLSRAKIGLG